jgi:hypothetical protein
VRLDNPLLVRWEYASEERLENRNAVLRALSRGPSPEDASVATVAPLQPKRLLDVGCGLGELGERFQNELGAHVCAIDTHVGGVVLADGRRDECTVRSQHTRALGERALEIRDVDADQLPSRPGWWSCRRLAASMRGSPTSSSCRTPTAPSTASSPGGCCTTHLAPQVPEIAEPFHARTRHVIFVAKSPR